MNDITNVNPPKWAEKYDDQKEFPKKTTFKLESGSQTITFASEGKDWHNKETDKDYIIFDVVVDSTELVWFAPAKAFELMRGIKALGFPLKGKQAVVTRTGKGRSGTRWSITPIKE